MSEIMSSRRESQTLNELANIFNRCYVLWRKIKQRGEMAEPCISAQLSKASVSFPFHVSIHCFANSPSIFPDPQFSNVYYVTPVPACMDREKGGGRLLLLSLSL